jgi:Arc/MetJ-type ribon-helix-helix transcriptional regulator
MAEWEGGAPEMVRFESFAQAQAERDRYKADLHALREGLEELLDEFQTEAGNQAVLQDWAEDLKRSDVAAAHEGSKQVYSTVSDRLTQLLQEKP